MGPMASVAGDPRADVARDEGGGVIGGAGSVSAAKSMIDVANIDVGAASVAASAGDFEIAYELLQDAIVAWQQATDLLLEVAADDAPALPRRNATVDLRPHGDLLDTDRPSEPVAPSPLDAAPDELPLFTGTPSAQPTLDTADRADATADPADPADGFFRRRRRSATHERPRDIDDDLVLDDVLAAYVLREETEAEIAEYDAWVDRLHDKRRQLQRTVRDVDRWEGLGLSDDGGVTGGIARPGSRD
jgi:hypothetical protein